MTTETRMESANRFGRFLKVVDTPGIFDTRMTTDETMLEVSRYHTLTVPGLHAVIVVLENLKVYRRRGECFKNIS